MKYTNITLPDKPVWKGPFAEGGITQSLINRFLECPFRFFLYAYMGLQEPRAMDERLIWGDSLHVGLEHLIRGHSLEECIQIMHKYLDDNYPRAPSSFRYTTENMLSLYPLQKVESWGGVETEVDIRKPYTFNEQVVIHKHVQQFLKPSSEYIPTELLLEKSHSVLLRGKVDMLSTDRKHIGDHKGKGRSAQPPEKIKKEINQDTQMNLYAFCFDCVNDWLYDIILIPEDRYDVPPIRVGETPKAWADRIFYTHKDPYKGYPIANQITRWINQVPHWQTDEAIYAFMAYTVNPIIMRIVDWWEHVTHPLFDINDPAWYNAVFYKSPVRTFDPSKTKMFECNFYEYLIGEQDIESLIPVSDFYPELEKKDAE